MAKTKAAEVTEEEEEEYQLIYQIQNLTINQAEGSKVVINFTGKPPGSDPPPGGG